MRYTSRIEARRAHIDSFVSFDPGVDYYSYAFFSGKHIVSVQLEFGMVNQGSTLGVVECPDRAFDDVRESDIYKLARAAGEIGGRCHSVLYVTPQQWKGQVPKKIHQAQHIWPKLSEAEKILFRHMNKNQLKQCLDAAGIGLWFCGRL